MEDEIKEKELSFKQKAQKSLEKKFDMKMTQVYPVLPSPVYMPVTPPKQPIQPLTGKKFYNSFQSIILPNGFSSFKLPQPTYFHPAPVSKPKISTTPKKIKEKILIEIPTEEAEMEIKPRVKPFIQNSSSSRERRGRPRKEDLKKKSSTAEKIFGCNVCSLFYFFFNEKGAKFAQFGNLKTHLRTHTGQK
jgi:hypothetical protein